MSAQLTLSGRTDLGTVREAVREILTDCDQSDVIDAVLVADEVATLACEYGDLPATVGVFRDHGSPVLRVVVSAARLSVPRSSSDLETSRRVLAACAAGWGVDEQSGGTTVWAHIVLPSALSRNGHHEGFPVPRRQTP